MNSVACKLLQNQLASHGSLGKCKKIKSRGSAPLPWYKQGLNLTHQAFTNTPKTWMCYAKTEFARSTCMWPVQNGRGMNKTLIMYGCDVYICTTHISPCTQYDQLYSKPRLLTS